MKHHRSKGFTLIELGIVLALLAILIAVMVPNVNSYILKTRITRAKKECRSIADAISRVNMHTRLWPYTVGPLTISPLMKGVDMLVSEMNMNPPPPIDPAACGGGLCNYWDMIGGAPMPIAVPMGYYLAVNDPNLTMVPNEVDDYPTAGRFKWQGPYVNWDASGGPVPSTVDPWGHAYLANVRYLPGHDAGVTGHNVMVLSAGPDGMIQTPASDAFTNEEAAGDDIAFIFLSTK